MSKFNKCVALLLVLVSVSLLLCGCGSKVKDDVPVDTLAVSIAKAIGQEEALISAGDSYIKGYTKTDISKFGGAVIMINAYGTSFDEFGIFKAGDLSAAEIKKLAEDYIAQKQAADMGYLPEEKPKLDSAEIKAVGNYVMFAILSDSDKKTAFDVFESALK